MRHLLRPLPLAMSTLLAACAIAPLPRSRPPHVEAPTAEVQDITTGAPITPRAAPASDVWTRLRGNFAMADCAADPTIDTWARRYTQSPERFEAQMRAILPRLVYVEESAARHGVASEFALLPWVESHFKPVAPRKQRAAGMWQIMPNTAHHMGLSIDDSYDARLDVPAATDAVMAMLSQYHDRFHDWRLTDYAYNAGAFGIDRLVSREGAPPAEPALPKLPVSGGTRQHLAKLMAIACVVRQPERFHVVLPTLPDDQHLVTVQVTQRLSIANAARQAGMPEKALADLNAGYRNGMVDPLQGGHLLLPRARAEQLRTSLLAQAVDGRNELVASVTAAPRLPDLGDRPTPAAGQSEHIPALPEAGSRQAPKKPAHAARSVHVVKPGDTLSGIAHRYHLKVAQLKRWNHLRGSALRVGQTLALNASR